MRNRYLLCRTPIVSVATDSHAADKISCCQTEIEGRGAAPWQGPPGCPEKAALDRYSGGPRQRPAPARAARPISRAAEQHAGGGPRGAPKKWPGIAIRGYENAGLPRFIGERVDENRSSGM